MRRPLWSRPPRPTLVVRGSVVVALAAWPMTTAKPAQHQESQNSGLEIWALVPLGVAREISSHIQPVYTFPCIKSTESMQ